MIVFKYKMYNELDVPAGPFDLEAIFGPFSRDSSLVTIPPKEWVELKGDMAHTSLEKVQDNLSKRIKELGLPVPSVHMLRLEEKSEAPVRPAAPSAPNNGLPTHGPATDQPVE